MIINFLPQNNYNNYSNNKLQPQSMQKLHLKPQLSADTVSFTAKVPKPKFDHSFFMDALGRGYDSAESGLIAKAKEFHGTLKRVAEKLKGLGFEYDEVYNSGSPIKKKKNFLDKIERQGGAKDIIRGTLYWQDQQDVMAFKRFLEEMKEEGWIISPMKKYDKDLRDYLRNKKGTIIKYPDLEIRQDGVTVESLAPLGEYLQRAEISRPRESTYADWQMRFVSTKDKRSKDWKQECELIFLYGPKYKDAKEIEHKYVYEPIRKMKKLHVDMEPENHQKGTAGYIIACNFKEIQKRLVQFVAQPLYQNAFNADLKIKDAEKLPVEISKNYAHLIINYAKGIQKSLSSYYSQISKELLKDEQVIESIKATPSYMIKEDKTITAKDIKEAKHEIRQKLSDWKEKDTERIIDVLGDLRQTVERFAVKD